MKIRQNAAGGLFLLLSSLFFAAVLSAQVKSEPVTIVSHVDIKRGSSGADETAAALLRAESEATQKDAGLISYVVLQEITSTNHFSIVETWRDQKAYDMHAASDHTVKFRQGIQPYLGSPFDSRVHHVLR